MSKLEQEEANFRVQQLLLNPTTQSLYCNTSGNNALMVGTCSDVFALGCLGTFPTYTLSNVAPSASSCSFPQSSKFELAISLVHVQSVVRPSTSSQSQTAILFSQLQPKYSRQSFVKIRGGFRVWSWRKWPVE